MNDENQAFEKWWKKKYPIGDGYPSCMSEAFAAWQASRTQDAARIAKLEETQRKFGAVQHELLTKIEALEVDNNRLQATHDHQYLMASLMLREAERVGRENDRLRALLRMIKATGFYIKEIESVLQEPQP